MLDVDSLDGKRFLDIGSGSGLFSLAARKLGAEVHSFDYDPSSVAATRELKSRYFSDDEKWRVERASVLDKAYVDALGKAWDVVYSWGVLHHTGDMFQALENASSRVREGGTLFIAIYNDQGRMSNVWIRVKKTYNSMPSSLRWLVLWPSLLYLWGPAFARDLLLLRPFHKWRNYGKNGLRGMSPWCDLVDWVGGYLFEVAKPEEIFEFHHDRGFALTYLKTCAGGLGCNEFVFKKTKVS